MAKVTLPAGPTRLQKNLAAGASLPAATSKATTLPSTSPKKR